MNKQPTIIRLTKQLDENKVLSVGDIVTIGFARFEVVETGEEITYKGVPS